MSELPIWVEFATRIAVASIAVSVVGLILMSVFRKSSAASRHMIGALTCASLVCLPLMSVGLPKWRLGVLDLASDVSANEVDRSFSQSAEPRFTEPVPQAPLAVPSSKAKPVAVDDEPMSAPISASIRSDDFGSRVDTLSRWMAFVYALGVAIGCIRFIQQHVAAKRLVRFSSPWREESLGIHSSRIGVRTSDRIDVPIVTGAFRPVILLPSHARSWPQARASAAVAHEMAHVQRNDLKVQWLTSLVTIAYWPIPFVHRLVSQMRADQETACDGIAAGHCKSAPDYARHLLEIAASLQVEQRNERANLAMARCSAVETRIEALLLSNPESSLPNARTLLSVIAVLMCSLLSTTSVSPFGAVQENAVFAQVPSSVESTNSDKEDGKETREASFAKKDPEPMKRFTASGRVVDTEGNPVQGVQIFYQGMDSKRPELIPKPTDSDGRFRLVRESAGHSFDRMQTWFYLEGHGVQVAALRYRIDTRMNVSDLTIPLPKDNEIRYQVFRADGRPCADAIVRPYSYYMPNGVFISDRSTGLSGRMPPKLLKLLERRTDKQGFATLGGIQRPMMPTVAVFSEEFGEQHFSKQYSSADPIPLTLCETGAIEGRVLMERPERVAGTKVVVITKGENDWVKTARGGYDQRGDGFASVNLNEEGQFRIPAVAAHKEVRVTFHWSRDVDVVPMKPASWKIVADKTTRWEVQVKPTVTLTGKILLGDNRAPVAGARIAFFHDENLARGLSTRTDAEGRYTIKTMPGKTQPEVFALGSLRLLEDYDYPLMPSLEVRESESVVKLEPYLLTRKTTLSGKLLDARGDAVPHVRIGVQRFEEFLGSAMTDREGRFSMKPREWNRPWNRRITWQVMHGKLTRGKPESTTQIVVVDDNPEAMELLLPD